MSTKTFQTIHRGDGSDDVWAEAAKLFSENYGVWGPGSGKEGSRVKLDKQRLVAQYLPDERSTYTRVTVDGKLVGQAFASRWEHGGETVCWITQLVVHRDHRRRGLAGSLMCELREEGDGIFGIMSSHPAACIAAANAYMKSTEIDLSFIKEHARAIMDSSPVQYVREAVPKGTVFDEGDTSGLVSGADSAFYVDHTEPLEVLGSVRKERWPLGDLPDGHEFLLVVRPGPKAGEV